MSELERELECFHEVLAQCPGERAAFIEAKHAGDPQLIRRLRRLLEAHGRAERSSEATSGIASAGLDIELSPERIGPYRVLELIGEGGMGVVYAAEQSEPFRRRVAIKVIKLGMDTREVIARFEAERQALAMMDHPGVAKALDAGVTPQGRPYFVMELVKGLSLVEYCAKYRLPLRERLRLFLEVCAAVQHAHQKGIIHRDLKPSNILVGVQEGRATPKVIDFGVAKATGARLTERTVFTEQGRLIGTLDYMSPEQAEMSGLGVDTRADVYSLGVILYELVTGLLPFDPKVLHTGGYSEILRIIREVDPPRPSSRLSALPRGEEHSDPLTQARAVRGELDWIVMRAIAKDPTRRYGTASALGDDIQRYLADRPVLAGPPGAAYAVRKFVRRNRYVTALLALVVLSVIVGVGGLWAGLIRARNAEALAVKRAENAQATAAFLHLVLFQGDPENSGRSLSLNEIMEFASRSIDEKLGPYPEVEASVRESIGVAYRRRSLFQEAEPHLRRSLQIRQELFGAGDVETARSSIAVADLEFEHEGKIDEALARLNAAHDSYVSHGMEGTEADAWLQLDIGLVNLAGDRLVPAERAFRECQALLERFRGPEHPDVSRPIVGLALIALSRDDAATAERLARRAVELCAKGRATYIGARAQLVLAQALIEAGGLQEASDLLHSAADQFSRTVAGQHIRVAELDALLAEQHLRLGEFGAAESAAVRCEEMRRAILHPDHWAILEARLLHQRARIGLGQIEAADPELRAIGEAAERLLGPDHPLTIQVAMTQLECATASGNPSVIKGFAERLAELRDRRAERIRIQRAADQR
jgi:non-specific serine/threonine protein kinase/serine/threonine-protein kinase